LFITITEKFNIQQTEKGDAISVLKDSFPVETSPGGENEELRLR
jgi:hypothetical protein